MHSALSLIHIRYDDIVEDVREECQKFGTVRAVAIPRPKESLTGIGKVFVEFNNVEAAQQAHASLSGRLFAGKSVIAMYYDEAKFAAGVF